MRALVIGAGGVGRAIANIASRRPFITSMVIADRTLVRAEDAVTRVKDARFSAAQVNAAELEDIRDLIRKTKPDIVINAVDPRFVMPIFNACARTGANYLDSAMSLSRPHPVRPFSEVGVKLGDEQFAMEQAWIDSGRLRNRRGHGDCNRDQAVARQPRPPGRGPGRRRYPVRRF